jgi:phage/plasmid-like protein (TIGR03299 family)
MAHLFESGLTVGEQSWHGLERNVKTPVKTVKEALVLGGLDWLVETKPIYRFLDDGSQVLVENGRVVVRLKDNQELGVVGPGWTPVQNVDAFEVLQPLIDAGYMDLATAGSLRKGARVYLSCKLRAEASEVVPGDTVEGYFLCHLGHDGKSGLAYKHTPIRVVCANTLGQATNGDIGKADGYHADGVRISHTSGIGKRVETLKGQIEKMAGEFSQTIDAYRTLARKDLHPRKFFETLLGIEQRRAEAEAAGEEESGMGKRVLERLLESYETQPGREFAPGTAWQAYNAVTYFVDHKRGRDENRQDNSLFGAGAAPKRKALELVLAA